MNFGILGTGTIARRMACTLAGLRGKGMIPYAAAARDAARAQAFAQEFGFCRAYGSYAALLADPCVDAVYIAVIHPMHAELIRAALCAGKHVLCEKPLTLNGKEASALSRLARSKGLLLTEAMWTRFLPFADVLRAELSRPELGPVQCMQASVCENLAGAARIAQPELGGGALMDIGVYALTQLFLAVPEDPCAVSGNCVQNESGADLAESISLCFPEGICAGVSIDARCGFSRHSFFIACRNGTVELEGPLWCPSGMTVTLGKEISRHGFSGCETLPGGGFEYEVLRFSEAVRAGQCECPAHPHREMLRVLSVTDALRRSWRYFYPGEVL